jgi:hypothetical protein
MTRRVKVFVSILILALTALCYWQPGLFFSFVLYPGIIVGLIVGNLHGESPHPYVGIAVGVVVNCLVYWAAFSWFRQWRKSSK